jgi:hypothetical protein
MRDRIGDPLLVRQARVDLEWDGRVRPTIFRSGRPGADAHRLQDHAVGRLAIAGPADHDIAFKNGEPADIRIQDRLAPKRVAALEDRPCDRTGAELA